MAGALKFQDFEALERIIDRSSVAQVIGAIEDICREKADHIRSNWQDKALARTWDQDAAVVGRVYGKLKN